MWFKFIDMIDLALLIKITGLALVDAVNVCAFAVLIAVLINILTKNADNPKKVLTSGLSFIAAVFIGYLFYAFVLMQFFGAITEQIKGIYSYIYDGFAVLAMIIGALNIKDFFMYKKGGIATEMPLSIRPKIHKLIETINSPSGAFVIGIFVTVFLLTCTIWPLMIAAGILSDYGFIGALPWFVYYNFLFVLPMLIITFGIYFSSTSISEVSYWQKKNVKLLHLIAGVLLFGIGLFLITGWL